VKSPFPPNGWSKNGHLVDWFGTILTDDTERIRMFSAFGFHHDCLRILHRTLILTTLLALGFAATSRAEAVDGRSSGPQPATDRLLFPAEYGEIVYRANTEASQQIFIIGQSHRSALTGQDGLDTVRVQAEIYRIGEWLIREQQVELLLPEGFFGTTEPGKASPRETGREFSHFDNQTLEAELRDTSRFVNADLLLKASYDIRIGQVEDRQLYRDIGRLLRQARQETSLSVLAELDGLQGERTAVMLRNIPEVVEEAFRTGRIDHPRAIFTIGLAHIDEIIEALKHSSSGLSTAGDRLAHVEDDRTRATLLDRGYGVTVIIPRTLAGSEKMLRLSRLAAD
jgi:hypothetical protein